MFTKLKYNTMKSTNNNNEPIAIIGMSCRFSQINSLDDFWQVLYKGKSVINKISNDRWNHDNIFDPNPNTPWKTNQKSGALLKNINHFDPYFFHISPKEAIEMSPSQKLMMELAWESYENSSLKKDNFYGSNTGVFIGNIWSDFEHQRKLRKSEINNFSAIGQSSNIIANRISYHFGLTGPSLVLDTGCSASLVALMLAVQSLRNGSSNMCITGGVNHIIDPEEYVYLSKFGGLSSKGKCSAFDADADGFVRGEGAGLVLLKRLADAERDNDKILAVIRGGAITNNGFNENMPATSKNGQIEVLNQAYKDAGVSPTEVDFIEAHGTGTRQGDPTEASALGQFFGINRDSDSPLLVGSVKTNIGHCEASSGIAGLIKAVMSLQQKTLPKNLNFNTPNPNIDFNNLKLKVPNENISLEKNDKTSIKAGVSSFGWGGTNAHVVLEEYCSGVETDKSNSDFNGYYLPLSAHTPQALVDYADKYVQHLNLIETEEEFRNICVSTANRKTDFEYKKLFYGKTKGQLIKNLKNFQNHDLKSIKPSKDNNKKVVFVFPGQGAQWVGMGRELYENEPVFKNTIDICEKAFSQYVDWSLKAEIYTDKSNSNLKKINVIQPYLFAMQVALAELWKAKDVEPEAVVGHSMGEVAAAYIAGTLTIEDAANIICSRSKLMNTLSGQGGAMLVTELDVEQANKLVEKYNGKISLAVQNSPKSIVLAGENSIIQEILNDLTEKDLFCRQVKVDVASHSPQMDSIKDVLFDKVQNVNAQESNIPIYSTVKNKLIEGKSLNAYYWRDNLRGSVLFCSVTEKLLQDGYNVFIEVSPHTVLSTAIKECSEHFNYSNVTTVGTLHREYPSQDEFKKNFGLLYENGYNINWQRLFQSSDSIHTPLPSYPFQRKNYEIKDLSSHFEGGNDSTSTHPLIGKKIKLADSDTYYWESKLSLLNLPCISHHQVNEKAVFPGGFYIEMVLAAIEQINTNNNYQIDDLTFAQSIELAENEPVDIQLKVETENENLSQFKIFKKVSADSPWEKTCYGSLKLMKKSSNNILQIPNKCHKTYKTSDIYKAFDNLGVIFKEHFQNVEKIDVIDDTAYATINFSNNALNELNKCTVSPILFDNCLHPVFSSAFSSTDDKTIKTTFVQGIQHFKYNNLHKKDGTFYIKTELNPVILDETGTTKMVSGDISVYDEKKNLAFELLGVSAKIIDTGIERVDEKNAEKNNLIDTILNETEAEERLNTISEYLLNLVAEASKASVEQLDATMTFKSMGIDSLTIVQLRNYIEKQLSLKLTISMFNEFPSIEAFSEMLNELLQAEGLPNTLENDENNKWLIKNSSGKKAKKQLFLFHDAGGSVRLFENWSNIIDDSVEILTIQLPGRDNREDEEPLNNADNLLDNLVPLMNEAITGQFIIFGHSMGGLLAFEVARRLQNDYNKVADSLIVSGTPCLKHYNNVFVNNIIEKDYSNEQLLSLITKGDQSKMQLDNDSVKKFANTLRNDFQLIYNYNYKKQPKLQCSIVAIHAKYDDRVNINDVKKWYSETEKDFDFIEVEGGHNYVYDNSNTASIITNNVTMKYVVNI